MKRMLLYGALALSLTVNVTVAALALRPRVAPGGVMMPVALMARLDADQREQVKALHTSCQHDRDDLQARSRQVRRRLAELLTTDPTDRAGIEVVLAQLTELQIALQRRVVEQALAVRAVLRPDQRPAFEQLMTERLVAGEPMQPSAMKPEER
jgi:Spy/CpxP family protein refolding chaperone